MNFLILAIFFSSLSWSLSTYDSYDGIPDHAPLSQNHDHVVEDFLNKSFKTKGEYDSVKVEHFLLRLRKEKLQLLKEMAEAIKLETLEIQFVDYSDALKEYNKALNEETNDYSLAYSGYLEPILEKAMQKILAGAPTSEIDSLVDSFMAIYYGFFRPGIKRNIYYRDLNPFLGFKKRLRGFSFSKFEPLDTIEANNLEVGTTYESAIENCLQKDLSVKHLLSQNEIVNLKQCQFDVSLLEPGKSTFFTNKQVNYYERTENLFPLESDDFMFAGVKYSGNGSLKLSVKVERIVNGKTEKHKFKIKMGNEVPQELISSNLSHKVGFHQDIMKYYPKVKINLPKGMTYMNLQRMIRRKYAGSMRNLDTFIESRAAEDEENQWLVIRNVIVEAQHPDKIQLDSYEIWGGDLPNRRESRGAVAFFSWINLQDIRPDNVRFSLVKRADGTYAPEYSIQDTGQSLGMGLGFMSNMTSLRNFMNFLRYEGFSGKLVNSFMNSHMKWNDQFVTFDWHERNATTDRFNTTTYSDIKWMARKIARLTLDEINSIVKNAAIHPDEQTLYILKLANRRNEMVEAFNLESEFPLFNIPDLDTYSPNENIQNGKIAVSALPGMVKSQRPNATIWPLILQGLTGLMNFASLENHLKSQVRNTTVTGYAGLSSGGIGFSRRDTELKDQSKKFSVSQVIPGIRLHLDREVGLKSNIFSRNNGNASTFYVRDKIKVEITAGIKGLSKLTQDLPINISANVMAWGREYTHTQTANSLKEAYGAPVKVFHIITDIEEFAATSLGPEEIISVSDSYGFEAKASGDVATVPLIKVGGSIATTWEHSKPIHFYRDTMGQLHTYMSKASTTSVGFNLDILTINYYISEYPVIGMEWSKTKLKTSSELYTFLLPRLDMDNTENILNAQRRKNELYALRGLLQGDIESKLIKIRKNADLQLDEAISSRKSHLIGIFHRTGHTKYSQTRINYLKDEEKIFHRFFYSSEKLFGLDSSAIPLVNFIITAPGELKKDGYTIDVQMEEGKHLEGIVYLNVLSYRSRMNRTELMAFIDHQSKLYAQSDSKLFYRGMNLPAVHEVNDYRKIFAHHRIYINTSGVLKHLQNLSNKEIKQMLKTFYRPIEGDDNYRRGLFMNMMRIRWLKRKMAKNMDDPHDLIKAVTKVIKSLNPDRTGTQLMRKLFGEENIYVMGDITGINSSFNEMQGHNLNHDRRFAGSSWGKFPGHPPIRKYLMDKEIAPLDYLVNISINTTDLYGSDPNMDADKF